MIRVIYFIIFIMRSPPNGSKREASKRYSTQRALEIIFLKSILLLLPELLLLLLIILLFLTKIYGGLEVWFVDWIERDWRENNIVNFLVLLNSRKKKKHKHWSKDALQMLSMCENIETIGNEKILLEFNVWWKTCAEKLTWVYMMNFEKCVCVQAQRPGCERSLWRIA